MKLCKDYLSVDAVHVLDPTMLLKAEDYLALTSESDYPKGKYIATYVLDGAKDKADIVKVESRRLDMPTVKVGVMHKDRFDSIESWLATIAHAERVITDSFHGTVFSLLFNRPVKVLGNNVRGNTRLQSLLDLLDLNPDSDGYIRLDENCANKLNALKEKSIKFLINSLEK